ncbi:MAG: hypothetical protein ACO1O4_03060 [Devosia sp.]
MRRLYTTLGALRAEQLGMILPHEHVFVDLRTPDQPGYAEASAQCRLKRAPTSSSGRLMPASGKNC